jgi:ribosomal protein S20
MLANQTQGDLKRYSENIGRTDELSKRQAEKRRLANRTRKNRLKNVLKSFQGAKDKAPMHFAMASFGIGDVVKHKLFPFRGVIFDVDGVLFDSAECHRRSWYALAEETNRAEVLREKSAPDLILPATAEVTPDVVGKLLDRKDRTNEKGGQD